MLVAERMDRVSVAVLRTEMDAVLAEVARLGVLHPTRVEEVDGWAGELGSIEVEERTAEFTKRRRRAAHLLEGAVPDGGEPEILSLDAIDGRLAAVEDRLEPLITARNAIGEKQAELRRLVEQLEAATSTGLPLSRLMGSSFLSSAVGRVHASQLAGLRRSLGGVPSVVMPYREGDAEVSVLCVTLRRDQAVLTRALRDAGFTAAELTDDLSEASAGMLERAKDDLASLDAEAARAKAALEAARSEALPELGALVRAIDAGLLLSRLQQYCRVTEKTCLFAGWTPSDQTAALSAAIDRLTDGRAVIEAVDAGAVQGEAPEVDVPVLMRLPSVLRPFALLVDLYGVPSYRMVNPTVFVAVTFLFMFGMMFGDVGHGLVLAAGGGVLMRRAPHLADAGRLTMYCGASSMAFGFLYGSVFGVETWLPALWVRPLEGIDTLFAVAVGFGVVMLSVGLLLNIANAARSKRLLHEFFDESGPLVAVAYWAAVGFAVRYLFASGPPPHAGLAVVFVAAPLTGFLLAGPILRLVGARDRAFPEGAVTYFAERLVGVMEILMGYLANTVSFIRVAAFGLAHAGLFVAVFSIAETVGRTPGGPLWSALTLVAGNVVIIVLEGLVVTIQALRLEYYEFFGKFFKSTGSKFDPVAYAGGASEESN